jgi:diaminohydroxyphosphoribosylaminopyrimidine deaminase / 5-amino-6-(5-phosphoribosylamino)uracil reductase
MASAKLTESKQSFSKQSLSKEWMRRALELAERGRGLTAPNPYVGAVIVRKGKVVGEGSHQKAGGRHAEIAALKQAGGRARGATMYVTLEPCCHTGRTGPCTDAIVAAGIVEVFYAMKDPNPLVNGKGAKAMRGDGLSVKTGPMRAEAEILNEIYLNRFKGKRPFVILKTAQTLDGRIACANGRSQWISGTQSLQLAHRLRAEVDAVVVGARAAEVDDPQLTVRHVKGGDPYRIVLSTNALLSPGLRLMVSNQDRKTIIATSRTNLPEALRNSRGLISWTVKRVGSQLDLTDFLAQAWGFGINSILVEGGSRLATGFLSSGLVDKHVIIIAPLTLGTGIDAVGDLDSQDINEAITYKRQVFAPIGKDVMFSGYPQPRASGK